jgi:hypothetical protein
MGACRIKVSEQGSFKAGIGKAVGDNLFSYLLGSSIRRGSLLQRGIFVYRTLKNISIDRAAGTEHKGRNIVS